MNFWVLSLVILSPFVIAQDASTLIKEIQAFESKKDPKCYATASRLEDFMFGTPLSPDARFEKNQLTHQLVLKIWEEAAQLNKNQEINPYDIHKIFNKIFVVSLTNKGHHQLTFSDNLSIVIHKDDARQYSSVAYSLRSILAAQQTMLMEGDLNTPILSQKSISVLKDKLDLLSLATLKLADTDARKNNQHQIAKAKISQYWQELTHLKSIDFTLKPNKDKSLLNQIIKQKLSAYKVYNNVSSKIFVRNLQVFYARKSWPKNPDEAELFRQYFASALIEFTKGLYLGASASALNNKHAVIQESDVYSYSNEYIPHQLNEYEDVVYFPKLDYLNQVYLEAYDMDSFRDSGIHWRYLQFALEDSSLNSALTADPFAAELITENIANYGILLLRTAGKISKEKSPENQLEANDLILAVNKINNLIKLNNESKNIPQIAAIYSSNLISDNLGNNNSFKNITKSVGIEFEHRSSDWLNRLLRSYLEKEEGVGIISIPPAFGGAGIASEDLDGDGDIDLLLLSGNGNKIFDNQGSKFIDISASSGFITQGKPGEPRQPLIADLDNDGDQDIIITYANQAHEIFENIGNKKFIRLQNSPLGGDNLVGGPATVFDANNDGLLDVYITYFGNYPKGKLPTLSRRNFNGLPNKLWINQGDLKFKEHKNSGLENSGWGQAVTHTDLNDDGLQDVIVGNDFGVNGYYINNGNLTFSDHSAKLGTDKPSYTMGIGLTDINQDLIPDVYISNIVTMNKDESYVLPSDETEMKFDPNKLATMRVVEANDFFISNQSNYQQSNLIGRGYNSTGWSWGADFFDYDNDSDMDLYVTNGMNEFNIYSNYISDFTDQYGNNKDAYMPVSEKETNVFFENHNGKLNNKTQGSGLDYLGNSRAATYFDWNSDGKLDVALSNYHGSVHIYENKTKNENNWLAIKLTGSIKAGSNLDAIGARLVITLENGKKLWREIHGSVAYMTVHPKQQNFGLGNSKRIKLEIRWPNGESEIHKIDDVNKIISIVQKDPA
ncbi:hypothetical protein NBRC116188_13500 [Oceaniserpentilla sp. 4NH20-0058]|uniref:CRTAC1 family protein n=1 Tax=Oceaniserpentilla sp. 4NH20-0058 TaxID=3127660 RepID=UPI003106B201